MMRNFDTELDTLQVARRVVATNVHQVAAPIATVTIVDRDELDSTPAPTPIPVVPQSPAVIVPVIAARSDLLVDTIHWSWEQLRDYVCAQIIDRHGPFPRDAIKEAAIFKGFVGRWGKQAGPIAVAAFTTFGGYWRSAPIAITRFAKGSDPYFAAVIAAKF